MKRYRPMMLVMLFQLAPLLMNVGCHSQQKPAVVSTSYGVELELCNAKAKTCEESIDCENKVRAKYNRPLRPQDGCQ